MLITLFNIANAFMELASENAGQYAILPMMIVIGLMLAWNSAKYVKEDGTPELGHIIQTLCMADVRLFGMN